jgi:hypothetical protein
MDAIAESTRARILQTFQFGNLHLFAARPLGWILGQGHRDDPCRDHERGPLGGERPHVLFVTAPPKRYMGCVAVTCVFRRHFVLLKDTPNRFVCISVHPAKFSKAPRGHPDPEPGKIWRAEDWAGEFYRPWGVALGSAESPERNHGQARLRPEAAPDRDVNREKGSRAVARSSRELLLNGPDPPRRHLVQQPEHGVEQRICHVYQKSRYSKKRSDHPPLRPSMNRINSATSPSELAFRIA